VCLDIPPLRQRKEDIPLLVERFMAELGAPEPEAELVDKMTQSDWPGNVRELRNAVERVALLGDPALWAQLGSAPGSSESADDSDVEANTEFDPEASFRVAKQRAIAQWETWYLAELLRRHGGNLTQAARAVQMDRAHLRELLHKHKVSR
jgi:DNA-binding NtrC family response regulator